MPTHPYLSVIIPAYNEESNFQKGNLDVVYDYLTQQSFTFELLLINDGSSDNTLSLLRSFAQKHPQVSVIDIPHGGKAAAVSAGIFKSTGQIILFSDMDQATPISEFTQFNKYFKKGF